MRQAIATWAEEQTGEHLETRRLDGVDEEAADLVQCLHHCGIPGLDGTGRPAADMHEEPFRPLSPAGHILSAYLQAAGSASWQKWYDESPDHDKVRILSCGGPTSGRSLVSMLGANATHFADWQWTLAGRWRLGLADPPASSHCKNVKQTGEQCREPLDPDHAVECPCGPLRIRRHNDLAENYADFIEEAGGLARMEVYVPEMSTQPATDPKARRKGEAWLDVWGYGICECPDILLDVRVSHPHAARYRTSAITTAGHAAAVGEQEKHDRYPQANGRDVIPVCHETWGRLGDAGESFLARLAAAARRRGYRRGRACTGTLSRWREKLDGTLHKAIAIQLAAAVQGLPGRRPTRRAPVDLEGLEACAAV